MARSAALRLRIETGMLVLETVAKIRREHLAGGKGMKTIAREMGLSRNTVRKVIRSGRASFAYERTEQPHPKLGDHLDRLRVMLEENAARSRRERLTLTRIHDLLTREGYGGSYDAVRRFAGRWQAERRGVDSASEAFVPLSFAPGDAYQFDWSHEQVEIAGAPQTVKVAHLRLSHSRRFYIRAYPRETQEMLFDAHARAFATFGGVTRRGIYDNMKTAVDAIFMGKTRRFNRRFEEMCSHYLIEPVACTPASGWEKGQVENQVGYARDNIFRPRLRFASLQELNGWLEAECERRARTDRHPEQRDRTVWEVYEAERAALAPHPGPFDGFHALEVVASATCLISFDRNRYSVMACAARRAVQVGAYADRIVVRCNGEVVAEHARCFGRDHTIYDPWHYLPVLARKPGALRNGAPFQDWSLPPSLTRLRRRLGSGDEADRRFVRVLASVLTDGLEAVDAAVFEALQGGTASDDVILNILARRREPPGPPGITTSNALALAHPPIADCARYDRLRGDHAAA
jgi:transposase